MEWKNDLNSFNSLKGLLYAKWYKNIAQWRLNPNIPLRAPLEASLDPIHACNLQCDHCNAHKYLTDSSQHFRMSDEHLINLTKYLGKWGVRAICFTGDTKVKLVNGTHKTFEELTEDWNKNKQSFEVYSRDEKGNIVPGIAINPRKTQEVTELIELTLDNNEVIKCTLDHKFMLKDGSYKEAKNLTNKDSLMPLHTKILSDGYEFIMDTSYRGATHRLFSNYWENNNDKIKNKKLVIHHKNYNKLDNTKNNLQQMTPKEHSVIHIPKGEHKRKMNEGRDKWNKSSEGIKQHKLLGQKYGRKHRLKYNKSKEGKQKSGEIFKQYNSSEKGIKNSLKQLEILNNSTKGKKNSLLQLQKINSNKEIMLKNNTNSKNIYQRKLGKVNKVLKILKNNNLEFNFLNYTKYRFTYSPTWEKAVKILNYNHKIISKKIIKLNKPISVYCLTVEKYHNFALSAGVFVKNCFGGGGEPTMHSKLVDALYTCKESGMKASIATNGTLFTKDLNKAMSETCRWIGVSVDAATAETYKVGRKADLFNKAITNIKELVEYNSSTNNKCDVAFKFLIFNYNQHEIYEACKLAKSLGVKDFHARPADYSHQGMGELASKIGGYDIGKVLDQFEHCHDLEDDNFHVYTIVHKFTYDFKPLKNFTQCYASPCCIQLCADGGIYLCPDQRFQENYKIGTHYPNVEGIKEVWGKEKHYNLVFKEGYKNCTTRCTFAPYCRQCEELFIKDTDPMCWEFI